MSTSAASLSIANCNAPLYLARVTRCEFSSLPVKPLFAPELADSTLNLEIMYRTDCSSGVRARAGSKGARHAAQQPKR